jgi:predicted ester cyclase
MTPTEVLQKQFEAFNLRDRAGWVQPYAPDAEVEEGRLGSDTAAIYGRFYDLMMEAFPDGRFEAPSPIEQGDRVAAQVTFTGTQTGTLRFPPEFDDSGRLGSVAPTGKTIKVTFANFVTVRDDKMTYDNTFGVSSGLANALGLMPAAAAD